MGIYDEMFQWSAQKLTAWRQDGLRRLTTKGELTEADYDDLYELAKREHGLPSDHLDRALPFDPSHFPAEPQAEHRITLSSINLVENVGRIPGDQTLPFGTTGLTVIYGGNGAGKSGYARILKQACRARTPGAVFADAFSPNYAELIPSARINFHVNGQADMVKWIARQPSHNLLRSISVFDSECANHYLRSSEAARLQPAALTNLQHLATDVARQLTAKCDTDLRNLRTDATLFDEIPPGTEAGDSFRPLSSKTDLTRAKALAIVTEEEQAELEKLPKEITDANSAVKAELLEGSAATLDQIISAFNETHDKVSDEAVANLQAARNRLRDAETAEKTAAALLENEETDKLLSGTGERVWSMLFSAAREFSTNAAYLDAEFPVVNAGARCVLCQQELDENAKSRLARFNEFVKDSASANAQKLRNSWKNDQAVLKQPMRPVVVASPILVALNRRRPGLGDEIARFSEDAASRHAWLILAVQKDTWDGVPAFRVINPSHAISEIAGVVRIEAKALRDAMNVEVLEAKRSRLQQLQARVALARHLPAIEIVACDLGLKEKLTACKTDAMNTRGITAFASKLSKAYISDALAACRTLSRNEVRI